MMDDGDGRRFGGVPCIELAITKDRPSSASTLPFFFLICIFFSFCARSDFQSRAKRSQSSKWTHFTRKKIDTEREEDEAVSRLLSSVAAGTKRDGSVKICNKNKDLHEAHSLAKSSAF